MSYDLNFIDADEFLLLYDINSSRNDYPYWNYEKFNLDDMDDDETWSEFRFKKNDIYRLKSALEIPDYIRTYNRLRVKGEEALCIMLRRFAYPCRYYEFITRFGRPVPDYCIIFYDVMERIFGRFNHLLEDFNLPFLLPQKLEEYAMAITRRGAALDNCFGFIDGTVRPICRPGRDQEVVYNGHKKVHSLKFQSVALPNGLIANMFGPLEGKRHDCALLRLSNLLPKLDRHAFGMNGNPLCLYGDPAYPLRVHLQSPYPNPTTAQQAAYNKSMSHVRVSVEWLFADITNWWAFIDFKKKLKLNLSAVGKFYLTCALLTNARTCLYGNVTSQYFEIDPPSLEDYFV
jgi:hypothetical protein